MNCAHELWYDTNAIQRFDKTYEELTYEFHVLYLLHQREPKKALWLAKRQTFTDSILEAQKERKRDILPPSFFVRLPDPSPSPTLFRRQNSFLVGFPSTYCSLLFLLFSHPIRSKRGERPLRTTFFYFSPLRQSVSLFLTFFTRNHPTRNVRRSDHPQQQDLAQLAKPTQVK